MVRKNAPLSDMAGGNAPLPVTRYAQIYRAPRHGTRKYAAPKTRYLKKKYGLRKIPKPFFVAVRQQYAASRSYNVT